MSSNFVVLLHEMKIRAGGSWSLWKHPVRVGGVRVVKFSLEIRMPSGASNPADSALSLEEKVRYA